MTDRIRSGVRVNKQVEAHIALLTEASNEIKAAGPKFRQRVEGMTRGIPYQWDRQDRIQFNLETLVNVGTLIGEIAVCDMWKRNGRIAYDVNEELAAALYKSKMEAVPGRLFEQLPHINPMVVLPDPWPIEGLDAWVRGFFIFGWVGTALCDTNDPQREGLGILFIYDEVDDDTGEIIPGGHRDMFHLPTHLDKFSVKDVIAFTEKQLGSKPTAHDAMKTFAPLLSAAFSVLTYLCCDNRDVEVPHTNTHRKKTGKGRKERDPFWVRVGWYVGPALHEARKRAQSADRSAVSIPSGVEYGPQHRAGHFKTVWTGPGKSGHRTMSTTKWVEPYWTKREMLEEGQDPVTQIIPVNPQRHDPLRRRDMKK